MNLEIKIDYQNISLDAVSQILIEEVRDKALELLQTAKLSFPLHAEMSESPAKDQVTFNFTAKEGDPFFLTPEQQRLDKAWAQLSAAGQTKATDKYKKDIVVLKLSAKHRRLNKRKLKKIEHKLPKTIYTGCYPTGPFMMNDRLDGGRRGEMAVIDTDLTFEFDRRREEVSIVNQPGG